jgi:hypothetical protein
VVTVKVPTTHRHHRGVPLKSTKDRMDIISAYRQVGSYRRAAELCNTTHRTVKKVIDKLEAGENAPPRVERAHNYDAVAELVAERVEKSQGRISAKRMLPIARAAGYKGSPRTSADWSQKRGCCGATNITGNDDLRCGHRVSIW